MKLKALLITLAILLVTSGVRPLDSAATPPIDLEKALDLNELKIAMAESSFQVNSSLRTLAELSGALENFLTASCFGNLLQTLAYKGPPEDPSCLARMERLLQIYPNNPVAVCLRDGVEALSCKSAYQDQHLEAFSGGSSYEEIPDPALKVGLSDRDSKKLQQLNVMVSELNASYQSAKNDEEKLKGLVDSASLYDQILHTACKVSALQLEEPPDQDRHTEDSSITAIRDKLLKIPKKLRGDYQRQLLQEAEDELARAGKDLEKKNLVAQKIQTIQNPDVKTTISATGKLRVRVVLSECKDVIEKLEKLIPEFPSTTCYRIGWHSPQCLGAVKKWQVYRHNLEKAVQKKAPKGPTATPHPLISTF